MKINSIYGAEGSVYTYEDSSSGDGSFSALFDEAIEKVTSADLDAIYKKASETYGVSEDLLKAVTKAESNFTIDATSSSGAQGLMQLMPATAESLGVEDAYDPEQNVMGGAKLLGILLDRYNGNVAYALAAYNAGGGAVDKYGGIPPFEQTQNYVAKILGYLKEGGIEIPTDWTATLNTSVKNGTLSESNESNVTGPMTKEEAIQGLKEFADRLFSHEDYEKFLELFIETVQLRLEERITNITDNTLTGDKSDNKSDDADEETNKTEAYTAYKNMVAANRTFVYLNPIS